MDSTGSEDAKAGEAALRRRIGSARLLARLVLILEQALPLAILPLSLLSLFFSASWFGLFRAMPDALRWTAVFVLTFAFFASLLAFRSLRWPAMAEVDRRLERENGLPHQAISAQGDRPVSDTAFARALWERHRQRLQAGIGALYAGGPRPDVSRFDPVGLRAVPTLVFAIALFFSQSGAAGRIGDAFRSHGHSVQTAGLRVDIWVTPPPYTAKPAITLTDGGKIPPLPQFSDLRVRISGGKVGSPVLFRPERAGDPVPLKPQATGKGDATPADTETFALKLETDGLLEVDGHSYPLRLTPDTAPQIAFDGMPRRSVNGALEIRFKASDDYGLKSARADIVPLDRPLDAQPLFPLPDYPLDLPSGLGRELKGTASRNLTEHPLAGKRVRISLLAEDGAGQTGRSAPIDMVLPTRNFAEPLAAAVAEQRQIFSLDMRDIKKAIDYNDAVTLRADESIPNSTHYLLIKSARARMTLARDEATLKDAAAHLWEIAIGIDGGDVSVAEKNVRDAQKALADALKRNAPDTEIRKLMDDLRKAMKEYMAAMARRMQTIKPNMQAEARNVIRQQDLERMLDQLENMARSGNRDAAQELLDRMQRMMNNLQAGPMQQRSPSEAESKARELTDEMGKLLSEQQKLMEETYRQNQEMQQEQWNSQADPSADPGEMSTDRRRQMEALRKRQEALRKQLEQLGRKMAELGIKSGKGLDQAGKEMDGAGKALGKGEGDEAVQGQGRAIEALRQGARDMMQAMGGKGQGGMQAGRPSPGQRGGEDPLGRARDDGSLGEASNGRIPDEIDVQRAREILEAIRKKLGDGVTSPTGRQYLERLLNLD